jgi:hypothetical protein
VTEKDGTHSEAASHGHGKTARKTSLAAEEEETEGSARFVKYSVTLVTIFKKIINRSLSHMEKFQVAQVEHLLRSRRGSNPVSFE